MTAGTRTLKEAVNEAMRDWAGSVRTTHYVIGSVVGPHPFPALVRDLQRVIGDEARAQYAARLGLDPQYVLACVGGGSNAIGMFTAFVGAPGIELIGVEAGGRGMELGRHCSSSRRGSPGVLHGALSYLLQDPDGQVDRDAFHLRRARLPGGRPGARLPAGRGPRPLRERDRRGGARRLPARWRGPRASCPRSSPRT